MHIHFFVSTLGLGGIETYILRVAQSLKEAGWVVNVTVIRRIIDKQLLDRLSEVATVTIIGKSKNFAVLNVNPPPVCTDVDIVFATGLTALLFATKAIQKSKKKCRLVVGVYWQFEYLPRVNDFRYDTGMKILRTIGPKNIVFCTEGCREDHVVKAESSWKASRISPLLINLSTEKRSVHLTSGTIRSPLKILSVGRIVAFKTYNFYMPGIIRSLLDKGYQVQWHVYGDGDDSGRLEQEIIRNGVSNHVTTCRSVPYESLGKLFATADLYIGAGTTLIEASSLGLPSIVAIDASGEPITPGYFCDRTGFFTSDSKVGEILHHVEDVIIAHIKMSEMERIDLSNKSITVAQKYSTSNAHNEFIAIMSNAKTTSFHLPAFFNLRVILNLVAGLIRKFMYLISAQIR